MLWVRIPPGPLINQESGVRIQESENNNRAFVLRLLIPAP